MSQLCSHVSVVRNLRSNKNSQVNTVSPAVDRFQDVSPDTVIPREPVIFGHLSVDTSRNNVSYSRLKIDTTHIIKPKMPLICNFKEDTGDDVKLESWRIPHHMDLVPINQYKRMDFRVNFECSRFFNNFDNGKFLKYSNNKRVLSQTLIAEFDKKIRHHYSRSRQNSVVKHIVGKINACSAPTPRTPMLEV